MIEARTDRRKLIALGAVVLLAGCKVIPKGPPVTPPPEEQPGDNLPADQRRHRVALLLPMTGANAPVLRAVREQLPAAK